MQRLKNKDYFDREFTGELDKDGYMISKSGASSNTKPSMNITGNAMKEVADMTKQEIKKNIWG